MRLHELAKELDIESKELIRKLADMGIVVKSHMSLLDEESVKKVKENLSKKEEKPGPVKTENIKPAEKHIEKQPVQEKQPHQSEEKKPAEVKHISTTHTLHTEKPIEKKPTPIASPAPTVKQPEKPTLQEPIHIKEVKTHTEQPATPEVPPEKRIKIEFPITAKELASKLKIKPTELISKLMKLGTFASINQNLEKDIVEILLHDYDLVLEEVEVSETILEKLERKYRQPDDPKNLTPRAPVVTFMGHVDHGKTSLMDTIRRTKVTEEEFGGITQHIGAYEVFIKKGKIVFLDTPGHEAFTAMRARGANITDIAVLVIAADDGVMPQTLEALDHARAAKVPIIIALNKIDKPTANPERVKRQLVQHGLKLEGWGGDIISCEVSATSKIGIDHFLEMILLQAEMLELKANPKRKAWGTVVESRLTRDKGPIATVLVQNGTLKVGDPLLCGMFDGKVKALVNDRGQRIQECGPSTPVEILGLSGAPDAGSEFFVTEDEKEAKQISSMWQSKFRDRVLAGRHRITLDDLYKQIEGGLKEIKIIVKSDTQGSAEALSLSLERLSTPKVSVNIIHSTVGDVTESDVTLAMASDAIIVGFHVKADSKIKNICKKEGIDLRLYTIIYQAVEEVRAAMEGLLEPKIVEKVTGRAKIKQVFNISKLGEIAGCSVIEGKMIRNAKARVLRGSDTIQEDQITSLKRGKDDTKEVPTGIECGIRVGKFEGYQPGDIIETYILQKEEQKL
jgi:translation initiation factor IF-2